MMQELPPIQQNHELQQQLRICLFCSASSEILIQHIPNCPGLSPDHVQEKQTFFKIEQKGNLCKNCWGLFTQADWIYHRKSQACRKKSSKQSKTNFKLTESIRIPSDQQYNRPISLPQHSIYRSKLPSNHYFSDGNYSQFRNSRVDQERLDDEIKFHQKQQSYEEFLQIAKSILAPLIRDWISRHQQIDIQVLLVYFTTAIVNFGVSFLQMPIKVPTWSSIGKANKQLNWISILERPENIFNQQFIDKKLENMQVRKQCTVIKALNKLSTTYKGMIKRRQVPTIYRQPRIRKFVKIKDLIFLIRQLLEMKKKQTVHLALDIYIILLSGMRFLADKQKIENGILEMIENNRQKYAQNMDLTFTLIVGKTTKKQQVCLNLQLVRMLKQFQWKGFHPKTVRLIARMQEWLGINGYSLKDTILSAIARTSPDLQLSQRTAGHASTSNTKRYTRQAEIAASLNVVSKIIVPGMHERFGQYSQSQLSQYFDSLTHQNICYACFKQNWKQLLLSRLYTQRYEFQLDKDQDINFTQQQQQQRSSNSQEDQFIQQQSDPLEAGNPELQSQQFSSSSSDPNIRSAENTIMVYGNEYLYIGQKFQRQDFFQKVKSFEDFKCRNCKGKINSSIDQCSCIFCLAHYHFQCMPNICCCIKISVEKKVPQIPELNLLPDRKKQYKRFLMPKQYFHEGTTENEIKIQTLLAIRRFNYTRYAVLSPGYEITFPQKFAKDLRETQINTYNLYLNGSYFPPIEMKPIRSVPEHPVYGVNFGIYAVEQIEKDVFIGQYGCDLLNGYQLSICKKNDSIMEYSGDSFPQDVFLAPKDFASYATLINTGLPTTNNCKCLRTIINGSVRVILYTCRTIRKGEQLLYEYGKKYKFISTYPTA